MLNKDRKARLGQNNDVDDILLHPWFKGLDIDALLKKQLPAPFIPKVEAQDDLRNFDPSVTENSLAESLLPQDMIKLIEGKEEAF